MGIRSEEIEFAGHGGDPVRGLLVLPDRSAPRPGPGIVLIHEVFGLDAHVRDLAARFATEGYAVLAPDLYSREGVPGPRSTPAEPAPAWTPEQIRAAARGLPDPRALGDLEGAVEALAARSEVDPERIGTVGFCLGGKLAFLLGCRSTQIAAVVDFYGRVAYEELDADHPIQPLEMALNLSAPVLAFFGEEDASIPPEHLARMREVLSQFAVHFDIVTFPGAGHGFFNDSRDSHHPEAALEAWMRTTAFLREWLELEPTPPSSAMSTQVPSIYDLVPGKRVHERYRVVGAHRQGGLSAAFEAVDEASSEDCELQFFPSALFEDEEQAREFASSWNAWKRVQSDSVLAVREIVLLGGNPNRAPEQPESSSRAT